MEEMGDRQNDCTRGAIQDMSEKVIKLCEIHSNGNSSWVHLDECNSYKYYIFKHCNNGDMMIYDLEEFSAVLLSHGYTCEIAKVKKVVDEVTE